MPIPRWYFLDNSNQPLANGTLTSYLSSDRTTLSPFYPSPSNINPWPNPLPFDGKGSVGPIYGESDIVYFIVVQDRYENIIFSQDNWTPSSGGGSGPITVNNSTENLLKNGQFSIQKELNFSFSNSTPDFNPFSMEIADSWFFDKDVNTNSDTLSFQPFPLGVTIPESSPQNYFEYTVTNIGTGGEVSKTMGQRISKVRSLENQTINFSFFAKSNVPIVIQPQATQFFGTGGSPSPSVTTLIGGSIVLTSTWTKYTASKVIPSTSGKTLGTNLDDYLAFQIELAKNQIYTFNLTNNYVQSGNMVSTYPLETTEKQAGNLAPYLNLKKYGFDTLDDYQKSFNFLSYGYNPETGLFEIGFYDARVATIAYAPNSTTGPQCPQSWKFCDGYQGMSKKLYPALFSFLQYDFGGASPADQFGLPISNGLFLRTFDTGTGMAPNYDPGRVIGTIQNSAIRDHNHNYTFTGTGGGTFQAGGGYTNGTAATGNVNLPADEVSDTETRPINIAWPLIIKCSYTLP